MDSVKKILVCLDLTDIDPELIRYAAYLAPRLSAEKLFFLHVIQAYDLPDKGDKQFPNVEKDLSRAIHQSLTDQISDTVPESLETEIVIEIEDQDAANRILECIDELDIDLVLIGQKSGEDRQGHYAKKIIKNCKSDTLFITADANLKIDKILCAIDFSKNSHSAFSRGLYFHNNYGSKLVCYYINDTTSAYFPASTVKSADSARKKAKEQYRKFLKQFDMNPDQVACHILHADANTSEGYHIGETAASENADLIIVGAKGDTQNVTSLLGHVCESLRVLQKEVPVMIVKNT